MKERKTAEELKARTTGCSNEKKRYDYQDETYEGYMGDEKIDKYQNEGDIDLNKKLGLGKRDPKFFDFLEDEQNEKESEWRHTMKYSKSRPCIHSNHGQKSMKSNDEEERKKIQINRSRKHL